MVLKNVTFKDLLGLKETRVETTLSAPLRDTMETPKDMPKNEIEIEEKISKEIKENSKLPLIKEKRIWSNPARTIRKIKQVGSMVVPLGSTQFSKWLHSTTPVRPIPRETDWKKVELKRLRLVSRR